MTDSEVETKWIAVPWRDIRSAMKSAGQLTDDGLDRARAELLSPNIS